MKKLIFTLILLNLTTFGFCQTKISGVVTYFFNEYQGNKPDIGASVILIDSSEVNDFNYQTYEKFYQGKSYREFYFSALDRYERYSEALSKTRKGKKFEKQRNSFKEGVEDAQKDMDFFSQKMKISGFDTLENIVETGGALFKQLFFLNEDLPKKTVDSNGNYSMNVEPGIYYVYIKSKNRSGELMPETDGKVFIKKVQIKKDMDKDVSYNFEL